jgi:hypothetical protein
VKGGNGRQEDT